MSIFSHRLLPGGKSLRDAFVGCAARADRASAAAGLGVAVLILTLMMPAGPAAMGEEAASARTDGGGGTNVFITVTPSAVLRSPTPQQIEAAKQARESRPAAQDPEGHWGEVTEGFQLSVRFEKESFCAGEPVTATVIIRNATGQRVYYRDFMDMREDSPVCQFEVLDEQKQPVPRLDPKAPADISDGPHIPRVLEPGTQCRYDVKLEARFKLDRPGKYSIRARRWTHHLQGDGYAQLQSGEAVITILKAAKGGEGANPGAEPASPH